LISLLDKITNIPINRSQQNPFLQHLERLSLMLKENSQTYIVQHLHYHFTQDVEALAQDRELMDLEYYLDNL
jgi:hypothetical protein